MASLEKSPPAITKRLGDVLYGPTAVPWVRRRGCGSGYRSSSRFIFARDIHARCERRLRLRRQAGSTEKPAMTTAMHARRASLLDGNSYYTRCS